MEGRDVEGNEAAVIWEELTGTGETGVPVTGV